MRFGVLGRVVASGAAVRWGMSRSVLAALLLSGHRVVSVERLVDVVWGDGPPASAVASLHNHVMRVREVLGPEAWRLRTVAPGYLLEVGEGELDLAEFERLSRHGREALRAADWATASRSLGDGLGLWRGEALEDVPSVLLREREAPRLEQLRLDALEARIEADLRLGRHEELVTELTGLVAAYPLRERFHEQLMLAHCQAGRQAEALGAFARARERLADELGADPGPGLRELLRRIQAGDFDPVRPAPREPSRPLPATRQAVTRATAAPRTPDRGLTRVVRRPAQLPSGPIDFTGRAAEMARLAEVLAGGDLEMPGAVPLAVVTGLAGSGKSSLIIHVAHQVRGSFPDGQLHAVLSGPGGLPRSAGEVLGWFLRALGVEPELIPPGEAERAAQYRSALAGQRVLVVLDDVGDSGQVAPLLPGTTGCAVLAASRGMLADLPGARLLRLGALSDSDSVRMLAAIIGAQRAGAEAAAVARLAEMCAGMPLALWISGSRLAARPFWPVAALVARLADREARLDELTAGSLSVRAAFDASYCALQAEPGGAALAGAFRELALWEGPGITAATAATTLGTSVRVADKVLEVLFDRHLLEPAGQEACYRFPALLGIYAADKARHDRQAAGSVSRQVTDGAWLSAVPPFRQYSRIQSRTS